MDRIEQFCETLDSVYEQGEPEAVEKFLLQIRDDARTQQDRWLMLTVQNELGAFYRGAGRYAESLEAFADAAEEVKALCGPAGEEYANILNNMAGTYRLLHRGEQAEKLFLQAMEVYQNAGLQDSCSYTSVLNNLSLVYQETGELDKAIYYLEQALHQIAEHPERQQELAITYNNLTTLYYAAGDSEKAFQCAMRAMQAYERCPEGERVHYAAVLNSLAGYFYGQGDWQQALDLYRKSAHYTLRFFGENEEYGITFQNMHWAYKKLGNHEAAIGCLQKAAEVYTKLFGAESDRTQAVTQELHRLQESICG